MNGDPAQSYHWRHDGCAGEICAEFLSPEILLGWLHGLWPEASELLKAEVRRETRRVEIDGHSALVKSFRTRGAWLPDRAMAVHRITLCIQALKVRVPVSLGCARGAGNSLHVAEWLDDAVPLLSFAGQAGIEQKLLPAIADLLAQLARLHKGGLVHGDLKWGNILLRGDETWLVDLDGVRRAHPWRSGARDLARFLVDCEEAGTGAGFVRQVKEIYARERGWNLSRVDGWIAADYKKISERHRRRYGADHRL
jgi:tRNA A-37 threonylcarbamoyl transferase component Bud32